ncbi:MAG TPA: hypothetical protein VMJ93_05710 [Verrucomicrobiae bacterium]|nr:hypothetical protein [Verrucomicrobiae bacterium]
MTSPSNSVLEALRAELAFVENGGYRNAVESSWRPSFIFQDSPICLDRGSAQASRPCAECCLAAFVPEEYRDAKVPCRHIPLNATGETIDSLYRSANDEELEAAVKDWLKVTISRLQREADISSEERKLSSSLRLLPPLGKSSAPIV